MAIQGPKIERIAAPSAPPRGGRNGGGDAPAAHETVVVAQEAHKPVPVEDNVETRAAIAARLEQYLRESGRSLEYRVDAAAHATVITVRRADNGEVVRQYPTEAALALLRRLNEQSGTLLDAFA
jgi:flagellar protein FlaG